MTGDKHSKLPLHTRDLHEGSVNGFKVIKIRALVLNEDFLIFLISWFMWFILPLYISERKYFTVSRKKFNHCTDKVFNNIQFLFLSNIRWSKKVSSFWCWFFYTETKYSGQIGARPTNKRFTVFWAETLNRKTELSFPWAEVRFWQPRKLVVHPIK